MKINSWSIEEDTLLIDLREKGVSFKDIALLFQNRTQDSIRNRAWILKNKENNNWLETEKIGFLDIEVSDLKANNGYILSWSLLADGKIKHDCIKKSEIFNGKLDRRILKSLLKELKNIDVIVTYYGTGMDVPFLRTRALMLVEEFPTYGIIKHIDLYYSVKNKLQLHRNSLDAATTALDIPGKTHFDIAIWLKAKLGDKKSLDLILEHNDLDVIILKELYEKLAPFCKFIRKSI